MSQRHHFNGGAAILPTEPEQHYDRKTLTWHTNTTGRSTDRPRQQPASVEPSELGISAAPDRRLLMIPQDLYDAITEQYKRPLHPLLEVSDEELAAYEALNDGEDR